MTNLALIVSLMLGTQQLQCGGSDIGKTVRDSLFNEVVRQDRAADAAWLACDTKEKLAARQACVRAGVLNAIGGLPEKTPLNARVTGRIKKNGYVYILFIVYKHIAKLVWLINICEVAAKNSFTSH